jgi:hypothetical protein
MFKGEIENFKQNKDSIIDDDEEKLDPDHLLKIIDI